MDLCNIMTKINMATTTNQPDKLKEYVKIFREEFRIDSKEDDGCTRIKSPTARIHKDVMIKTKGILLKLVK